MTCRCYPANDKCPSGARCVKRPSLAGRLLCRLGRHRTYHVQRSYNDKNELVFWIRLCHRHCGWTDVGPNYRG
jgi:hypothetical protein